MIAPILWANAQVLRQGADLLRDLPAGVYNTKVPTCFNSSPGGHLRHVVDHYTSFLAGWRTGRMDYEHRERDAQLEQDATYAGEILDGLITKLEAAATESDEDASRAVRSESLGDAGREVWQASSLGRELEFLLSHTVHHYALIAVMLRLGGVEPPADFGVAPSTLRFWQNGAFATAN